MATQLRKRPVFRRPSDRRSTPPIESRKSITVDASPEECYRLWRDVANLPRFLSFVESIRPTGDRWFHWVVWEGDDKDKRMEWDVELTRDEPDRALAWTAPAGSSNSTSLFVWFDPAHGRRGTVVRLLLKRGSKPDPVRAGRELHRFKQWRETGEIATTEGQTSGRRGPPGRALNWGDLS